MPLQTLSPTLVAASQAHLPSFSKEAWPRAEDCLVSEIFIKKKKKSLFCSVSEEGCRQALKAGGSGVQITLGHGDCRGWECYFSPVVERPPALDSWLSVRRSFPLWSNWQLQVQYGQLSRGLQTLYLSLCKPGRQESGFLWKVAEGWSIQPVDSGSLRHRDAVSKR